MPSTTPSKLTALTSPRQRGPIWPAAYLLGFFCVVGGVLAARGEVGQFVFFALMGLVTGGGLLFHALARPSRKHWGRKASLVTLGLGLGLGAGVFGRQSFQLEGFFFYVLAGVFGGVVVHYLVAKIAGPLLIGRAWCGWACWIWMVFDFLPWKRSPGRRARLGWLRPVHFALSLGLVAVLVFGVGYDHGFEWKATDGLAWFLGGCAWYWLSGGLLAALLKDNRAFCKYLCPITVFLRAGSRASLLKVGAQAERCTGCGACSRACPMDVPVAKLVAARSRVLDAECTFCLDCVAVCPKDVLAPSLGLDLALRGPRAPDAQERPRSE